jgi:uncharacterized protein (DUF1015 family)
MATIEPFPALRPSPTWLPRSASCRRCRVVRGSAPNCGGNPLSFLHVSKPEIDLPSTTDNYDPIVYAKGKENFTKLILRRAETDNHLASIFTGR